MRRSSSKATDASPFVCDCEQYMRLACASEPFYREHDGKLYCVLHFPGSDKSTAFNDSLKRKLDARDFNFCGVWFPDKTPFSRFNFTAEANFNFATFNAEADFDSATFNAKALFDSATFNAKALFYFAEFNVEAHFNSATFNANANFNCTGFNSTADFSSATFNAEVSFFSTRFNATAYFLLTTFKDHARFSGEEGRGFNEKSSLNLYKARIEKPERFSFHTLTLSPHWFINVDARRFDFTNVDWGWHKISFKQEIQRVEKRVGIKQQIESLERKLGSSPHRMLSITCRQLAVNAEENHRYEEASKFRYWSMDARRQDNWHGFAFWTLNWWYWAASGYSERVLQAFLLLIGIWILFAFLYTQVSFVSESVKLSKALIYSLGVMLLQKPEPRPATIWAQSLVMIETILGPLQAALLALAIRRKFMR